MNMSINVEIELQETKKKIRSLKEEDNPELIREFMKKLLVEGETKSSIVKYVNLLIVISGKMEKSFLKVTKKDAIIFLSELEESDYPQYTKRGYRIVLERFFRFLGKEELVQDAETMLRNTKMKKEEFPFEPDLLSETATGLIIYLISLISGFLGNFPLPLDIISQLIRYHSSKNISQTRKYLIMDDRAILWSHIDHITLRRNETENRYLAVYYRDDRPPESFSIECFTNKEEFINDLKNIAANRGFLYKINGY